MFGIKERYLNFRCKCLIFIYPYCQTLIKCFQYPTLLLPQKPLKKEKSLSPLPIGGGKFQS